MVAFCDEDDVRDLLQEHGDRGALGDTFILAAIEGASSKFAKASNTHWYDSGSEFDSSEVPSSAKTVSAVRLDVPNSPHRQDRLLFSSRQGVRYPVTHAGPYAKVTLPHPHVETLNKLEVRDRGGNRTDWVADSDFVEGVDEDYYIEAEGQDSYGRTHLYIRASSIGTRTDYDNLLVLDYDYGVDWNTTEWWDVRRGIAALAAVEVLDDDDVLAQIPDNGQLIGVSTQYDNVLSAARTYLDPYISALPGR